MSDPAQQQQGTPGGRRVYFNSGLQRQESIAQPTQGGAQTPRIVSQPFVPGYSIGASGHAVQIDEQISPTQQEHGATIVGASTTSSVPPMLNVPSQLQFRTSRSGSTSRNNDYFTEVSRYKQKKSRSPSSSVAGAPEAEKPIFFTATSPDIATGSSHLVATPSPAAYTPSPLGETRRWPSSRPASTRQSTNRFASSPFPQHLPPMRPIPYVNAGDRTGSNASLLPPYQPQMPSTLQRPATGVTSHVQHYDPTGSPAMIQSYTPRMRPSVSFCQPVKPSLSRNQASLDHSNCELGMVHHDDGEAQEQLASPEPQAVGLGGTLTGLYNRMVGVQHSTIDEKHISVRPRSASQQDMAFILGRDEEPMEHDDPRLTGFTRKSIDMLQNRPQYRRSSCTTSAWGSTEKFDSKRGRSKSLANIMDPLKNASVFKDGIGRQKPQLRYHSSFEAHIEERWRFVLKLARALMLFGAPSHRVESQLNALCEILDVNAQFIHFPGIVIASFGDAEMNTSHCHFVKSHTEIALGRMNDLHALYKQVMADEISIHDASCNLTVLINAPPEWSNLSRIIFTFVKCGMMAPINFGGSFVDIWISALFGGLLTFSQLCIAKNNQLFSNVFDIAVAILFSFLARLLSVKSVFCYEAVASSGLIGLLPGYAVFCASLELASKNMMTGSVRMVYAIIYSLFLGFAIAIGSDLYYWVDPKARQDVYSPVAAATQLMGTFMLSNETMPHWTGSFTFTNSTSAPHRAIGEIGCTRMPDWPWWRQTVPPISKTVTVPVFSLLSCLSFLHPLKSKEVPVSVIIACIGYAANSLANHYIFDRSDVVSAIGSFVIGILGNAYSRIWNATAFTAITVAVSFLVPSGMAMAGGLAMTYKGSDGDLYTNGLSLGFRMVQVSIGITTGLFVSAMLVHMLGNKRSKAVLFAF